MTREYYLSIIRVIRNEGRREKGRRCTDMHGEVGGHSRIKHHSVVPPHVDSPGKRSQRSHETLHHLPKPSERSLEWRHDGKKDGTV